MAKNKEKPKKKFKLKITKKKVIILLIIIIIAGLFISSRIKASKASEDVTIETQALEKRNIATSISATGTITTSNVKNVTSKLTGYEITSVNVTEGQKVNVGDVICTFDTTKLQRDLNDAKASLGATQTQNFYSIKGAERSLNDAITSKDNANKTAQSEVDKAQNTYNSLNNSLASANASLNAANGSLESFKTANAAILASADSVTSQYAVKEKAFKTAETAKINAETALTNANNDYYRLAALVNAGSTDPVITADYNAAQTTKTAAESNVTLTTTTYNTAKADYDAFKPTYDKTAAAVSQNTTLISNQAQAQAQVASLTEQVNQAKSALDTIINTKNTQTTTADSTIAGLSDTLASSKAGITTSTITQQSQISALQEQLADGKIVSTVSGTVTSVGVKKGDLYSGTTIAVIDGCDEFIIESQIDEYDIPDIKEGMKVFVKTDATRDEELEGTVTYTAPSATTAMDSTSALATTSVSTGSSAKYKIKIELDEQNDRLRLGMNAKISIVTNSKDNVLAVPFDSVNTRDDGSKYITILEDETSKTTRDIDVTTGIEGTYYVEVNSKNDELKEGMKVVLPKADANASVNALLEAMGADAGM